MRRWIRAIRKSITIDKDRVKKKEKDFVIILLTYLFITSICLLIPEIIIGSLIVLFIAILLFTIYSNIKGFIDKVKSNLEE